MMDRLTERHYDGNGHYMKCSGRSECDGLCGNCDELEKIVDRLAAYERTGLEPADIQAVCAVAARVEEYKSKAGTFELPPVKIGDFAWVIRNYKGVPHAQVGKVTDMYFTREMKLNVAVKHIARGAWGEAVFATQEDAEKAIAERKRAGHV